MMTTVASIEKIWMPNKKTEEKVLNHEWSISETKVRALCTQLHFLLTTNQPLSETQSLMLHQQLSCYVLHTAQGRCKTALPLSCFIDFTQLLRKKCIFPLQRKCQTKVQFRMHRLETLPWEKKNLYKTFQSEKHFLSARFLVYSYPLPSASHLSTLLHTQTS